MQIVKLKPLSICDTNSFLLISQQNNAALIDAPDDAEYILSQLEALGAALKMILLTHGHFDHVGAVADLAEKTGCAVYVHEADAEKLCGSEQNALTSLFRVRGVKPYTGAKTVADGDILRLDELEIDVMHTPGHTSGSVCYIVEDVMFSGDTLFARSVGRTDLPDGSYERLMESMEKIKDLGGNLRILPGHMCETSLDSERRHNPYLIERK